MFVNFHVSADTEIRVLIHPSAWSAYHADVSRELAGRSAKVCDWLASKHVQLSLGDSYTRMPRDRINMTLTFSGEKRTMAYYILLLVHGRVHKNEETRSTNVPRYNTSNRRLFTEIALHWMLERNWKNDSIFFIDMPWKEMFKDVE